MYTINKYYEYNCVVQLFLNVFNIEMGVKNNYLLTK